MTAAAPALAESQLQVYASFESVVELIRQKRDMLLAERGRDQPSPCPLLPRADRVRARPRCPARPCLAAGPAPAGLDRGPLGSLGRLVRRGPTLAEAREAGIAEVRADAAGNPLVQAILAAFPGARITDVRSPETLTAAAAEMALPPAEAEMDDDWDPFEE